MKKRSPTLTPALIAAILRDLALGLLFQHQIAAKYGINQGRISEIKTGKRR